MTEDQELKEALAGCNALRETINEHSALDAAAWAEIPGDCHRATLAESIKAIKDFYKTREARLRRAINGELD